MSDAVSRLIADRAAEDGNFRSSVVTSSLLHAGVVAGVFVLSLFTRTPPLKVMDGFAAPLPRGGGGAVTARTVPPVVKPPKEEPQQEAKPAPAPRVIKPPKDEPNPNRLPEVDQKKVPDRKGRKPDVRSSAPPAPAAAAAAQSAPGGVGLTAGPGVPEGTDVNGDWYLAGVQRKVWSLWMGQMHSGMAQTAIVSFSINADGSVADVRLVQTSGSSAIDLSAQRAIYSAQPFGPLPRTYGTNRITIQASFKPDA